MRNIRHPEQPWSLLTAANGIARDATVRVLLIAGAGRTFCAGHDLKEIRAHPDPGFAKSVFERASSLMLARTRLPQPGEMDNETVRRTAAILDKPSAAIAAGKRTFYAQIEIETGIEPACELATDATVCNIKSDDAREGISAFADKCPPRWKLK